MIIFMHPRKGCKLAVYTAITLLCSIPTLTHSQSGTASDTLQLTCTAAEKIFLERNIAILCQRLNINQAEARILQARAWPNPVFHLDDIQLYNKPSTAPSPGLAGTEFWKNRTFAAQLEQMVQLAGKRKKNIALETRNKELAESSFTDMLLSLKAGFRQDIAELQYLQHVSTDLSVQQRIVSDLVRTQSAQFRAGNISQSQLYRLKALQISLQGNINELNEKITALQQSLKTLMALDPGQYILVMDEAGATGISRLRNHTLDELLDLGRQHNPGLQSAASEKKVSEAGLALQKAYAVPDLTFNLSYDRNGNNQLDFVGAGIAMDLPVFNRNKGNIKAARYEVQKSELLAQNKANEVNNAVVKTWLDLNRAIDLYDNIDKDYLARLDEMIKALSDNFLQRNISMLEFLDFFESFKDSKEQYYSALRNISLKKEELNYLTGQDL
jgi:cobalt-zinc-cadmium efflux system outer membrane protein